MNQRPIKFRSYIFERMEYWGFIKDKFVYPQIGLGDINEFKKRTMQFTGLKGKNGKGKEVYQSDLIRSCPKGYEPREIYEVVWDEERLEWGVKSKIGMITSLWTFDKDFEVIGNIYSNSELLK